MVVSRDSFPLVFWLQFSATQLLASLPLKLFKGAHNELVVVLRSLRTRNTKSIFGGKLPKPDKIMHNSTSSSVLLQGWRPTKESC